MKPNITMIGMPSSGKSTVGVLLAKRLGSVSYTHLHPELFQFDGECLPKAVAGCPPDAFSATGQLWGNPLYDWGYHKKDHYSWWIKRMEYCLKLYDVVRVDHFRGFEAYYSIPYGDLTAELDVYKRQVDVLDISAFDGNAKSYVVRPDGRVVIDHSFESWGTVYNFFGVLREHSNMSEKEILQLSEKFKEGRTDAMLVNLDGSNYYLIYGRSKYQDWIFLGLVQADIVNASMNSCLLYTSIECLLYMEEPFLLYWICYIKNAVVKHNPPPT